MTKEERQQERDLLTRYCRVLILDTVERQPHGLAVSLQNQYNLDRRNIDQAIRELQSEGMLKAQGATSGRLYYLADPAKAKRLVAELKPDVEQELAAWRAKQAARKALIVECLSSGRGSQEPSRMPDHELTFRVRLLNLWETMADRIVALFLKQNVLVPELEKILRWRAARSAMNDSRFSVPARDEGFQQSQGHAAVFTGLTRHEIAAAVQTPHSPVDPDGGSLHRMIRILVGWRNDPGYQDEQGDPIDLALRGPTPSFHQLCQKYGRDTPTRPLADALVMNGNAEWIGESEGNIQGKTLRFIHSVVTAEAVSAEGMLLLTQYSSDILHSLQQRLECGQGIGPRFRQAYFDDIDPDKLEEARSALHEEMELANRRFAARLETFRSMSRKKGVRLGVGSYSFLNSPLIPNSDE